MQFTSNILKSTLAILSMYSLSVQASSNPVIKNELDGNTVIKNESDGNPGTIDELYGNPGTIDESDGNPGRKHGLRYNSNKPYHRFEKTVPVNQNPTENKEGLSVELNKPGNDPTRIFKIKSRWIKGYESTRE